MPRRIALAAIVSLATAAAIASLAWAATSSFTITPSSGPAGTVVQATGSGFGPGQVEIRWGSSPGHHGALLTTVTGPDFSIPITIPPASAGTYYLDAAPADEHASENEVAVPFQVTGNPAPPAGGSPTPPARGTPPPAVPLGTTSSPGAVSAAPRTGARARAIRRCKRKYSAKRGASRAEKRRLLRKKRACRRRARKLPA